MSPVGSDGSVAHGRATREYSPTPADDDVTVDGLSARRHTVRDPWSMHRRCSSRSPLRDRLDPTP